MRLTVLGIIYFCLVTTALAGLTGKVENIGLASWMRQDCTVPILVSITSDSEDHQEYGLQVVQYDLDGDEVAYTKQIPVNPGTHSYWTYFKPQCINQGLPSIYNGKSTVDLAKELRIYITSPDGNKRLVQISTAGKMPQMLDPTDTAPGSKLMVCVGRSPNTAEFDPMAGKVLGLRESMQFVPLDIKFLPDNVIGYEAVDYLIWTNADPSTLEASQLRALKKYVRNGGKLVVIQNAEFRTLENLKDLLPINLDDAKVEETSSIEPLRSLVQPSNASDPIDINTGRKIDQFAAMKPPFRIVKSSPTPDAYVVKQMAWPDGSKSPYIARRMVGQGMVVWIAQDITEPNARTVSIGWPNFWNSVLDLRHEQLRYPTVSVTNVADRYKKDWRFNGDKDLGYSYTQRLDLESKTTTLISVAVLFFIGYWMLAGPGLHLILAVKKRTSLSWFLYGATAILATVLTVGVAELVLRGAPQIRHISLVRSRSDGNEPARITSRFGIYVPRDETNLEVKLSDCDDSGFSQITPLVKDPRYSEKNVTPRDSKYVVPVKDLENPEEFKIGVPFRSTLKKLQSDWTGQIKGRIFGNPIATNKRDFEVAGKLTNNTGHDLQYVVIAFPNYTLNDRSDEVIYLKTWPKDQSYDLGELCIEANKFLEKATNQSRLERSMDGQVDINKGRLADFNKWLIDEYRTGYISGNEAAVNDSMSQYRKSYITASLFDRLSPLTNISGQPDNRVDLLRRGLHNWDISHALACGNMVIIASSFDDTIPVPLEVGGSAPEGNGTIFWQFIVPLDKSQVNVEQGLDQEEPADTKK